MPPTKSEKVWPPVLQNSKSKLQTPASLLFDLHYAKLGIIPRWDWDRFNRLARFLNITIGELASLVLLPHSYLRSTAFPLHNRLPGSTCLLLTLIEAQMMKSYTDDIIENPIPKHGSQAPTSEVQTRTE